MYPQTVRLPLPVSLVYPLACAVFVPGIPGRKKDREKIELIGSPKARAPGISLGVDLICSLKALDKPVVVLLIFCSYQ